ncbi:MAG: CarD family transcriptional regulator [Bacillota bacterium]|jgi:CarD family transcriptional regulator
MFAVGDKVVYPVHGAGVIQAIEQREILGQEHNYYVLHIPFGDMTLLVPVEMVNKLGMREVIPQERVSEIFDILRSQPDEFDDNWNRRYRQHMDKIKSGDIIDVAQVVRNLMSRNMSKGLSTGEKKLLDQARQILVSELMLAEEKSENVVMDAIDQVFIS